jgi:hypothetical protein
MWLSEALRQKTTSRIQKVLRMTLTHWKEEKMTTIKCLIIVVVYVLTLPIDWAYDAWKGTEDD